MRNLKKLRVLAAVVFVLGAIGAASASAAEFTASETGLLTGSAENNQVFTFNGGTLTCVNAATSGTISKTHAAEQHVTVKYSGCTAFGYANVHVSDATYEFTAETGKNIHIRNTFSITPTFFGSSVCTVHIGEQTKGTIDYSNPSASTVKVSPTVTGIRYVSTGGSCGEGGENGTYTGASVFSRKSGGTYQHKP